MGKYNESDIIKGTRKELNNGMIAGKVLNQNGKQVFRIIGHINPITKKQQGGVSKKPMKLNNVKNLLGQYYETNQDGGVVNNLDLNKVVSLLKQYFNDKNVGDKKQLELQKGDKKQLELQEGGKKQLELQKGGKKPLDLQEAVNLLRQYYIEKKGGKCCSDKEDVHTEYIDDEEQEGGNINKEVSLKTAVNLLRQYYNNKYE